MYLSLFFLSCARAYAMVVYAEFRNNDGKTIREKLRRNYCDLLTRYREGEKMLLKTKKREIFFFSFLSFEDIFDE